MSLSSRKIQNQIHNSLIIIWLNCCRMWRHNDDILEDGYVKYSPVSKTGFKTLHFLIRIEMFWTIIHFHDQKVLLTRASFEQLNEILHAVCISFCSKAVIGRILNQKVSF